LENIFGIIIFIIFIALRTMSDRKKGMNRGQKAKPVQPTTKPKSKPLIQAEPTGPHKVRPVAAKPAPPVPGRPKSIWPEPAVAPPPIIPKRPAHVEGESDYGKLPVMEGAPSPAPRPIPKLEPVAATEGTSGQLLSYDDLRRAVLWSEILAKPRALRRNIR